MDDNLQNNQNVERGLDAIARAILGNYGQVTSFTNSGSAGGTFYYVTLGKIKVIWGNTNGLTVGTTYQLTYPTGFFTSTPTPVMTAVPSGSFGQYATNVGSTLTGCSPRTEGGAGSPQVWIIVIGT